MSDIHKAMEQSEQRKKPIALAVSFVLLFICLMVVIVFATKNIGYQQQIQKDTGEQIVEHFKQLDRKLAYLQSNFTLLESKSSNWDEAAALTSASSQYLLEDVYGHIGALLAMGHDIKPEQFGDDAEQQLTAWYSERNEFMGQLSESDELVNQQYLQLKVLGQQVNGLKDTVAQFNFKLEGNKSAMIRLSAGFDWMELAQQMHELATVDS